jgi:catechol 2,3-dioxygenase-like lactoylglutathione lyase family enzyme
MFAQINHVAMTSPNWPMIARFYEAVFGMKASGKSRPMNGATVGDGVVGLNVNPMRAGAHGGLDHFGMTVDDVDLVMERARKKFPEADILARPSTRPFAAYSAHDPDGNTFDLSEKNKSKLDAIYADQAKEGWKQTSYVNKYAFRTMHPEKVADFYMEVFELEPLNLRKSIPGYHMTDGRVMLSVLPWKIKMYEGMALKRPGPDHIGFKVDDMEIFREHLKAVAGACNYLAPIMLGGSKEEDKRRDFLAANTTGKFQMADPGAVWIDVTDEDLVGV